MSRIVQFMPNLLARVFDVNLCSHCWHLVMPRMVPIQWLSNVGNCLTYSALNVSAANITALYTALLVGIDQTGLLSMGLSICQKDLETLTILYSTSIPWHDWTWISKVCYHLYNYISPLSLKQHLHHVLSHPQPFPLPSQCLLSTVIRCLPPHTSSPKIIDCLGSHTNTHTHTHTLTHTHKCMHACMHAHTHTHTHTCTGNTHTQTHTHLTH